MKRAGPIVEWRDAVVHAPDGRALFGPFDWVVEPGEFWCLLGANGAGKSSLVATVAGLITPAAGRLRIAGRPIESCAIATLASLRGLLPQSFEAPFGLDALQTVMLARDPRTRRWLGDATADRKAALAALARFDVEDLAGRDMGTLSGGERQRVGLASLLAQQPMLHLLDEPLTHLDMRHQVATMRLFADLVARDAVAVVAAVHDVSLAARHATHALLIGSAGEVRTGPVDTVLDPEAVSDALGFPIRRILVDGAPTYVPAGDASCTNT